MYRRKKYNELTPKDAKAVALRLKGKTNYEIAKILGSRATTRASAAATVSDRIRRARESKGFNDFLEKMGAGDRAIVQAAKEALGATDVKLATDKGTFTDRLDVPDHAIRLRAAELIGKWKGLEKSESHSEEPKELHITLTIAKPPNEI